MEVKPGIHLNDYRSDAIDHLEHLTAPSPLYSGISVKDHREVKGSHIFYRGKHYIITKLDIENVQKKSDAVYIAECDLIEVEAESVKPNPILGFLCK